MYTCYLADVLLEDQWRNTAVIAVYDTGTLKGKEKLYLKL
jgi:hypothetical protein